MTQQLTDREIEVMNLVKLGFANKQVAKNCGIREQTAKNHLSAILCKLVAVNRAHAVYICLKRGLIAYSSIWKRQRRKNSYEEVN